MRTETAAPLGRENERKLYEVMRTLRLITETTDLDRLLQLILSAAKRTMGVEASSLMLLDPATGELYFDLVDGGSQEVRSIRLKPGQGIAGRVAEGGRPLVINDVRTCPFFYAGADRRTGFQTRQVLAVPLRARGALIGVLEAVNKPSGEPFTREDLQFFSAFASQAAVAVENARLYQLAAYDGLTRVFNRRHFDQRLEEEARRLGRAGLPLSLLMLDLDHFKRINDTRGHPAGDAVLAAVGRRLKALVREADLVGRYGGEEFAVALPGTGLEPALSVAERIRQAVGGRPVRHAGEAISVTASVGAACAAPAGPPADLLARADRALYRAKLRRDCVAAD